MSLILLVLAIQSSNLELACVSKVGMDMYQAMDGTVVWTERCQVEAECVRAVVRFEPKPMVTFGNGRSCRVVKVAQTSDPD